jgi:DNA transposition AAA+ family ATPase
MEYKMCLVRNVMRLNEAGKALVTRSPGTPGMGALYGATGYGKTTAVSWWINQFNGVYVRAMAMWTPSSMLNAILRELDSVPEASSCARQVEQIVERLTMTQRPLILDEADYIIENKKMTETLRDLHDMANVPVILVGMAGLEKKISLRQQLSGRIAQWVSFLPADLADARMLADETLKVVVEDDLLAKLHKAAGGSIRLIVVGLARIESFAKANSLSSVKVADWKNRDFFFGAAPADPRANHKEAE